MSSHLLSHLTDYLLQRVRGEERLSSVEQVSSPLLSHLTVYLLQRVRGEESVSTEQCRAGEQSLAESPYCLLFTSSRG